MRKKRQGLIIWYKHRSNLRHIRRYGHLIYASKRLKYALLYVNEAELEDIEQKLQKHAFVKQVDRSILPLLREQLEQKSLINDRKFDNQIEL